MAADEFIKSPKAFLGRGWSFPPNFVIGGKSVDMLEGEEDIKSSLSLILSTTVGERVMQPQFGCNLDKLLFEPLDQTFETYITDLIKTAFLYFEARINLEEVTYNADQLNGKVDITINFTIIGTNTRSNIVYPFYLNEGTDVTQ